MIQVGTPPFLECSSRGDKRFSSFYARPSILGGRSIEEAYQAMKIFADGTTGLSWREAKGRRAMNQEECVAAYTSWWAMWVKEQKLLGVLRHATGLSDVFGQKGSVCQAEVLWKIRNRGRS